MTGYAYEYLADALDAGAITEAQLRTAATRTFRLRFQLGLFDDPALVPFSRFSASSIDTAEHRALALQSAQSSLVLLRNQRGLLPLDASKLKRLAIVGPNANRSASLLSNYQGCRGTTGNFINKDDPSPPCRLITPLAGLRARLPQVETTYDSGCDNVHCNTTSGFDVAVANAAAADLAVVVVGLKPWTTPRPPGDYADAEGEAHDRSLLGLPGEQATLVQEILKKQPRTVLVLMSGAAVSEPTLMSGASAAPAIVQAFYGGEEAGTALAKALFGDSPFGGKLPVTIVPSLSQLPPYLTQQMSKPPGRTHRYFTKEALFPFGFGLTTGAEVHYADATITPAHISAASPPANLTLEATVSATTVASLRDAVTAIPEVVQVYFGVKGDVLSGQAVDREAGAASVPLHDLRAFRRVSVGADKLKLSFDIPVESLQLMQPSGEMALTAGKWTV